MGVQINGDTGNVIATKGTYSGNVTIGGTLTYEDVTNIDSVGLVTARNGIEIGARPGVAASISVDGNAIFSGITTVGSKIDVTNDTHGNLNAVLARGADPAFQLQTRNDQHSNNPQSGIGTFGVFRNDNDIVGLKFMRGTGADGAGSLAVTQAAVEKVIVTSDGKVGIGENEPDSLLHIGKGTNADDGAVTLTIGGSSANTRQSTITKNNVAADDRALEIRAATGGSKETIKFFSDNTTETLRIASDGKIGIGTVTANAKLHILHSESSDEPGILLEDASTSSGAPYLEIIGKRSDGNVHQSFAGQVFLAKNRTGQKTGSGSKLGVILFGGNHTDASKSNILYAASIAGVSGDSFDSATDMPTDLVFYTGSTGRSPGANNVSSGSERVRIPSGGGLLVGTTSSTSLGSQTGASNVSTFNQSGITLTQYGVTAGFYYDRLNFTNSQYYVVNDSGTGVYLGNGNTSWTAHSDERLKINITELDGTKAYNHVKTARATSFKWNATGYGTDTKIGFIAQDWETNYPEVVNTSTETLDGVENPKGIQYTETVPVLMAALKEAIAKIETLEAEVDALKSS